MICHLWGLDIVWFTIAYLQETPSNNPAQILTLRPLIFLKRPFKTLLSELSEGISPTQMVNERNNEIMQS